VILDHVPDRANLVVVARPAADSDLLGDVDLDAFDQGSIPHRLEDRVTEPEGEGVLDRVLRQVVIDAEDLLFTKRLSQPVVDLAGAGKVVAERLLDHDAALRTTFAVRQAGSGQRGDDWYEG